MFRGEKIFVEIRIDTNFGKSSSGTTDEHRWTLMRGRETERQGSREAGKQRGREAEEESRRLARVNRRKR
jgi:hypothetical protein